MKTVYILNSLLRFPAWESPPTKRATTKRKSLAIKILWHRLAGTSRQSSAYKRYESKNFNISIQGESFKLNHSTSLNCHYPQLINAHECPALFQENFLSTDQPSCVPFLFTNSPILNFSNWGLFELAGHSKKICLKDPLMICWLPLKLRLSIWDSQLNVFRRVC